MLDIRAIIGNQKLLADNRWKLVYEKCIHLGLFLLEYSYLTRWLMMAKDG